MTDVRNLSRSAYAVARTKAIADASKPPAPPAPIPLGDMTPEQHEAARLATGPVRDLSPADYAAARLAVLSR